MIFSFWGFTSGLFTNASGFFMSASIGSACDSTLNRFFDINSFLFLLLFMVGELGSEEFE